MSIVKVQGNASGTGIFTVTSPATNTDRTLTLPDSSGTIAVQGGTGVGKVLQVVQGQYTTSSSSSSTTYVDTGLSASITPTAASSKILVLVSFSVFIAGSQQGMATLINIVRGSTQIWETNNQAVQTYDQGGSGVESGAAVSANYLDSPATTSSTTYKVQIKRSGGTESRWRNGTITLLEIAA